MCLKPERKGIYLKSSKAGQCMVDAVVQVGKGNLKHISYLFRA